jgi:protein TonB
MSALFSAVRQPRRIGARGWWQAAGLTAGFYVVAVLAWPRHEVESEAPRVVEPELVFMRLPAPRTVASSSAPRTVASSRPVSPQRRRAVTVRATPPAIVASVEPAPRVEAPPAETEVEAEAGTEGSADEGEGGGGGGDGPPGAGVEGGVPGANGEAVGVSLVREPPRLLQRCLPRYPAEAERDELEGEVVLTVIVGRDGRVEPDSIRVTRSQRPFDAAAIEAVRRWLFSPAVGRDGRVVRVIVEVPVRFVLT